MMHLLQPRITLTTLHGHSTGLTLCSSQSCRWPIDLDTLNGKHPGRPLPELTTSCCSDHMKNAMVSRDIFPWTLSLECSSSYHTKPLKYMATDTLDIILMGFESLALLICFSCYWICSLHPALPSSPHTVGSSTWPTARSSPVYQRPLLVAFTLCVTDLICTQAKVWAPEATVKCAIWLSWDAAGKL